MAAQQPQRVRAMRFGIHLRTDAFVSADPGARIFRVR